MKQTCGLIALLCAVSIGCNFLLVWALRDSFTKLHFSRIFPLGFVPEGKTPLVEPSNRVTVTFWGDSRAHSWGKYWQADGSVVVNFAHGAQTSSQLRLQLESIPPTHTEYSVVQIGINDLHPLGVLNPQKQQILEHLTDNIIAIRNILLARSDTVVLTTIFPPARVPFHRRYVWDPATIQYVAEINQIIRRASNRERVILLDANALLRDKDLYLSDSYTDEDFFLHVNRGAYEQLNIALQHTLTKLSPQPR